MERERHVIGGSEPRGSELGLLVTRIHEDQGLEVSLGRTIARMRGGRDGDTGIPLANIA